MKEYIKNNYEFISEMISIVNLFLKIISLIIVYMISINEKIRNIIKEFLGKSEEIIKCPICWEEDDKKNLCYLNCNHYFHFNCINEYIKRRLIRYRMEDEFQYVNCPMCRQNIEYIYKKSNNNKKHILEYYSIYYY